jgi:hypothetical protein
MELIRATPVLEKGKGDGMWAFVLGVCMGALVVAVIICIVGDM